MEERDYWLAFSVFSGVGPVAFKKLLDKFGTAKLAWESTEQVLGDKLHNELKEFKKTFSIKEYKEQLKKKDVWFITLSDKEYPKLLKQIKKPPFVLFGRGNKDVISNEGERSSGDFSSATRNDISVGVVGTRKTTQYGRDVTKIVTAELVAAGCTIVSGLALGVDAVAHMTAVEHKGKTIAVLGCGVDCCTPRENQSVYNSILQNGGAIVSELPLGHGPTVGTFPARNRIIAGLSDAVLVTEGAIDSGALITADYALKNNRPVFAVPGQINSQMAQGPLTLLKKGAKMVTSGEDILNELKIQNAKVKTTSQNSKSKEYKGETKEEQVILDLLVHEALHFDDIVRLSKIDSAKIGSILSMMEIKGVVKSDGGSIFSVAT